LRKYELSEEEWDLAAQLRDQLKILKDATSYFSRILTDLSMVIPAMDIMDTEFTDAIRNPKLDPSIRAAIRIGKKTLNRYYSMTDASSVFRIAIILHPHHRLQYFKNSGWEPAWIAEA
ncbi:hypothetical protein BDN72DRAFT_746603, partial [Pluteus cervinus]